MRPGQKSRSRATTKTRIWSDALANQAGLNFVLRFLMVGFIGVALAGCATPPPDEDPDAVAAWEQINDPIEPLNRSIFDLNLTLDGVLFRPVAEAYRWLFPEFLRDAIQGVLSNAGEPNNIINAILQADVSRGGQALGRLAVNSTLGIAGMIDVASEFGLTPVDEDFGQTLAVWGVGDGAYLMLPVLGPSSVRDGIGRGVDIFLNPLTYLFTNTDTEYVGAIMSVTDGLDQRSRNIEVLDDIERTSVDFYAAIRSLYRQARQDLIYNGETTGSNPFLSDGPDLFDDSELSYAQ
jgi:phospholipid-binding lipoprotein MlaA